MNKKISSKIERPCIDWTEHGGEKCDGELTQFIQLFEWDQGCWTPYRVTVCLKCGGHDKEELKK